MGKSYANTRKFSKKCTKSTVGARSAPTPAEGGLWILFNFLLIFLYLYMISPYVYIWLLYISIWILCMFIWLLYDSCAIFVFFCCICAQPQNQKLGLSFGEACIYTYTRKTNKKSIFYISVFVRFDHIYPIDDPFRY